MKTLFTPEAPQPIGPYSQGTFCGEFLFLSGQGGLLKNGTVVEGGIQAQTEQCIKNIEALLSAADAGLNSVVDTTCFLADMGDFPAFNEIYEKYFTSKPARTTVAVKTLPLGLLCEIKAVAYLG
jgi:2-iminobutanoate/2-iminopropanoate deaminase